MISTDLQYVYTVFQYSQHLSASYYMYGLYNNADLIHSYSDVTHTVLTYGKANLNQI